MLRLTQGSVGAGIKRSGVLSCHRNRYSINGYLIARGEVFTVAVAADKLSVMA